MGLSEGKVYKWVWDNKIKIKLVKKKLIFKSKKINKQK